MSDRPRGPRRPLGAVIRRHERKFDRQAIVYGYGMVAEGPEGTQIRPPIIQTDGYVGWVTTAITAASGATAPLTLGFGNVSLGTMSASGVVTNTGPVVKVWNWSVTGFAVGEKVSLDWKYGELFVEGADCPP